VASGIGQSAPRDSRSSDFCRGFGAPFKPDGANCLAFSPASKTDCLFSAIGVILFSADFSLGDFLNELPLFRAPTYNLDFREGCDETLPTV